jgi:hypothetical protein
MAMKRFSLSVVGGLLSACPASAATIVAAPAGPHDTGAIVVSGTLQPGDDEVFSKRLMQFPKGVVVFQGDGGDLQAAIKIGTAIRLKNYATLVPTESSCASACAVAWLGGAPRLMQDGSQIGFHAAYAVKGGQATEAGAPNALLGSYLGKIGLPDRAVVYITEAPPERMKWLSSADAEKMGIDVKRLASPKPPSLASVSADAPALTTPVRDQQVKGHSKKRQEAHVKAREHRYFVSWVMEALHSLSSSQSTKITTARDKAARSR